MKGKSCRHNSRVFEWLRLCACVCAWKAQSPLLIDSKHTPHLVQTNSFFIFFWWSADSPCFATNEQTNWYMYPTFTNYEFILCGQFSHIFQFNCFQTLIRNFQHEKFIILSNRPQQNSNTYSYLMILLSGGDLLCCCCSCHCYCWWWWRWRCCC